MDKRYLAICIALGVAIGAATDNLAIGILLGVAVGLVMQKWKTGKKDDA